jgi:hypothetical protein
LIPAGIVLLIVAFHTLNGVARGCRRWTAAWLSVYSGGRKP